jgi:hypothetical protein
MGNPFEIRLVFNERGEQKAKLPDAVVILHCEFLAWLENALQVMASAKPRILKNAVPHAILEDSECVV